MPLNSVHFFSPLPAVSPTYSVKKEGGKVSIHVEAQKPCKVVLVDEKVAGADGAAWEMQNGDCVVSFEKGGDAVCVLK